MGNIDNKKRVCKLQGKQKYMILIAFVFVVVSLSLILFWALTRNPIQGEWSVDGVTTYEFYKNGKGSMVLPSAEYSFSYTIEEDVLYIDFAYEGAKDAQYTFHVEGDSLILEGGNSTTQGTLILKRVS